MPTWHLITLPGELNGPNGNRILPNVSGTYSFWSDENVFYFVPHHKFLGGYFMPYAVISYANGSLVADVPVAPGANLSASAGGSGLADTYVQPFNLGWHLHRVDFNAGYAFFAPTGRYTPGASNNVGSGYWGNAITTGTTLYLTKNKGTSASLATAWEIHRDRKTASIPAGLIYDKTPGQAFTMEWGLGQVLPLKKDMSVLGQLGLVGYDQFQVTDNGGTVILAGFPVPAESSVLFVSCDRCSSQFHSAKEGFCSLLKYFDEYRTLASVKGRTFVFGLSWTLKIPKAAPTP